MLSVAEALDAVLDHCVALPPRSVPLRDALGCLLAEDIAADLDLPPFDKSLMDGFAVRTSDLEPTGETWLKVGETITAGMMPTRPVEPGEAAAIMTGAPIPAGADTVVPVERSSYDAMGVRLNDPEARPGRHILTRGREMQAGEIVARRGERLNPARLGLLASVGLIRVSVHSRPRIAIVPTGDELVEPDRVPGPGQIRNSNATLLEALASKAGAVSRTTSIAPDQPQALADRLSDGLQDDLLLITGGVSAGKLDLVPAALERLGVTKVFHKIKVKPGKPLWFGVGPSRAHGHPGTLVFGLPGNPVSAAVGFALMVAPAIEVLAGGSKRARTLASYPLAHGMEHRGDRPTYQPARLVNGKVEPLAWAGSSDLRSLAAADGLAVFAEGDRDYLVGELIPFLDLS